MAERRWGGCRAWLVCGLMACSPTQDPVSVDPLIDDGGPAAPTPSSTTQSTPTTTDAPPTPPVTPPTQPAPAQTPPATDPDLTASFDAMPVTVKGSSGWRFFSDEPSAPTQALGISVDDAGNLWVAGETGIYLRRAGSTGFEHHPTLQPALSVAGGPAGIAYVGYRGQPGCSSAFDNGGDPAVYKSGDVDRVQLLADGTLAFAHYDISSGPGIDPKYPNGREKLCSIYRVVYDAKTQSLWFGGNHGVAWGDPSSARVIEHTHPAINGYVGYDPVTGVPAGYTLLSGDYNGLAVDANGDLWLGGTERSAKLRYAGLAYDFWKGDAEIQKTKLDIWPDAIPADSAPNQRVDDWVFGFAPMPDGSVFAGSLQHGLAFIGANGRVQARITRPLLAKGITAVRFDPSDASVWLGHASGGITRFKGDAWWHYGSQALGRHAGSRVHDIAIERTADGGRRVWVAFSKGVAAFEGP